MAWTHDDENNTLQCVSEKHGRDLTIQLPKPGDRCVYCRECWRNCTFFILPPEQMAIAVQAAAQRGEVAVPRMIHLFNPSKPQGKAGEK